jgi:predicted kinase
MNLKDILDTVFEDLERAQRPKFEQNKVYTDEVYKVFSLNEEVERKLIIMVGLPGSGKTTFAKKLKNATICSADNYFEKNGEYNFDINNLHAAHRACLNKANDNMLQKIPTVVIDNTNLTNKARLPYEKMAENYGYKITYVVFQPDKKKVKKFAHRNLHGVDAAKLEVLLKKFRPPTGTKGKIIYK